MIPITETIAIDERELSETFIRASGPGGQNVNKVATAVQLRFAMRDSRSLTDEIKARLARLAGSRLTADGEIVITAQRFRTRERNREDALERLVALVRRALEPPIPRHPTKPTRASQESRLAAKQHRAQTKQSSK